MSKHDYLEESANDLFAKLNALPGTDTFSIGIDVEREPEYEKPLTQTVGDKMWEAIKNGSKDRKKKNERHENNKTEETNLQLGYFIDPKTEMLVCRAKSNVVRKFPIIVSDSITKMPDDDDIRVGYELLYDLIQLSDYPDMTLVDIDSPNKINGYRLYRVKLTDCYILAYPNPMGCFGKLDGNIKKVIRAIDDPSIAMATLMNAVTVVTETNPLRVPVSIDMMEMIMDNMKEKWSTYNDGKNIPYNAIKDYKSVIESITDKIWNIISKYMEEDEENGPEPILPGGGESRESTNATTYNTTDDADDDAAATAADAYDEYHDEYDDVEDGGYDDGDGESDESEDSGEPETGTEERGTDDGTDLSGDNGRNDDPYARHLRSKFKNLHKKGTSKNARDDEKEEEKTQEKDSEKLQTSSRVESNVKINVPKNTKVVDHAKEVTIEHDYSQGNSLKIERIVL